MYVSRFPNRPNTGRPFYARDKYTNIRDLQASSEGTLEVVRSQETNRVFVLKKLRPELVPYCGPPDEVRALMLMLQPHRNIIAMFEARPYTDDRYLMVLEYCRGGDLYNQVHYIERILRQNTHDMFILHVFVQLGRALAYLHHGLQVHENDRGEITGFTKERDFTPIIHGDVKPDNILLRWGVKSNYGMPDIVLADFGQACEQARVHRRGGTPGYAAPERSMTGRHAPSITTAVDIYGFGMTILWLIGSRFRVGDDPERLRLPESFRVRGMTKWLKRCLQCHPRDRLPVYREHGAGLITAMDHYEAKLRKIYNACGPLPSDYFVDRRPAGTALPVRVIRR